MLRMKLSVGGVTGEGAPKRLRSATLAALVLLLFSPAPSLSVPVDSRIKTRSVQPAADPDAAADTDAEKVFFTPLTDGDGAGSKAVVQASVGETAVLECEASGRPNPTVHWVRNGHRIMQTIQQSSIADDESSYEVQTIGGRRLLRASSTKSKLYIDCVTLEDAGTYQCVAETPTKRIISSTVLEVVKKSHRNGKHRNHRSRSQQVSDVLEHRGTKSGVGSELASAECSRRRAERLTARAVPARVYMWTVHRIEIEGADVQLYCRATGNPAPKITWYDRDDNKITASNGHYKLLPSGDLLIHAVTWTEHMGLYRCVANNDGGSDYATTFLYPTTE